jgi:hypothetical protein
VCDACWLLTKFDLKRNEFGVYGTLTVYDIESWESLEFESATAIPEIKATNVALILLNKFFICRTLLI